MYVTRVSPQIFGSLPSPRLPKSVEESQQGLALRLARHDHRGGPQRAQVLRNEGRFQVGAGVAFS